MNAVALDRCVVLLFRDRYFRNSLAALLGTVPWIKNIYQADRPANLTHIQSQPDLIILDEALAGETLRELLSAWPSAQYLMLEERNWNEAPNSLPKSVSAGAFLKKVECLLNKQAPAYFDSRQAPLKQHVAG